MKRVLIALAAWLVLLGFVRKSQNDNFLKEARKIGEEMNLVCMGYHESIIELGNPFSWITRRSKYHLIDPSRVATIPIPKIPVLASNKYLIQVNYLSYKSDSHASIWIIDSNREYVALLGNLDEIERMSEEEISSLKPNFRGIKFWGQDNSWMMNIFDWLKDGMPKSADYCD